MRRLLPLIVITLLVAPAALAQEGHSGGCHCGRFATSRVLWELEVGGSFVDAAVAELDRWNRYIDVFDHKPGDGSVGLNSQNEITMLSIAATRAKYGVGIDGDVFGFTVVSPESAFGNFNECPTPATPSCGTFVEADVIINTEFLRGFKPNGPIDFDDDNGAAFFGGTAVHEIGHALGFHHNFANLSVMNYYEDYAAQYIATSDAEVARTAYAAQTQQVTDIATYPFSFNPQRLMYRTTTPVSVSPAASVPGGEITVRSFGFENVGTSTLSNVEVMFYLSVDPELTPGDALLGGIEFDGEVEPGAFWDDEDLGEAFVVPEGIKPGRYYVVAMTRHSGGAVDDVTYNNSWVAPQQVVVTPVNGSARRRGLR